MPVVHWFGYLHVAVVVTQTTLPMAPGIAPVTRATATATATATAMVTVATAMVTATATVEEGVVLRALEGMETLLEEALVPACVRR